MAASVPILPPKCRQVERRIDWLLALAEFEVDLRGAPSRELVPSPPGPGSGSLHPDRSFRQLPPRTRSRRRQTLDRARASRAPSGQGGLSASPPWGNS